MMSLKEYREPTHRLPDHLPWAMLVAPGVVLQKDGLLQKTVRFRGPDLGAATYAELVATVNQLNNAFRRLGGDWSVFVEAQRLACDRYPTSEWPTLASFLVDEERVRHFRSAGMQFESSYYLTLAWKLPHDREARLLELFYEARDEDTGAWRRHLESFQQRATEFFDVLRGALPEAEELDDQATLTFLHSTVSTQRHPVRVPRSGCYLDAYLPDEPFSPGELPMLGDHFLGISTVQDFPSATYPGVLDALNHLHLEYRWTTRWIALDREAAKAQLKKHQRLWLRGQKGMHTALLEQASGSESRMVDHASSDNADDAAAAQRALGSGDVSFGYLTTSLVVWDRDPRSARRKQQELKKIVQQAGFVVRDETFHAWQSWLGSVPGHVHAGVRRPILHTRNLADLIPSSAVWAGASVNEHLEHVTGLARAHIYTTSGSTPFRLNTNNDDLGHTAIFGPPGAGKSTLVAMLGLQFLKYPGAQIIMFDVHRSARAATLANGGAYYEPGNPSAPLAFQPLADIHDPSERVWVANFVLHLLELQKVELTPTVKRAVDDVLTALAREEPSRRTLTLLANQLGVLLPALKEALRPYTVLGNYGQIFDANTNTLAQRRWTLFEMDPLMKLGPEVVLPALGYLIHHIERWCDGRPTILALDECWKFMGHAWFADWFQAGLKTLRKKNVYVYFATQEIADLMRLQGLTSTVLSACPTQIFGADESAASPEAARVYRSLGLTDVEIGILARARKKRDYYYRSPRGRRLFSLSLGPAALAFAGMSSPADQRFLDDMVASRDPEDYALAMLEHRGVQWAVEEIHRRSVAAAEGGESGARVYASSSTTTQAGVSP